MCACKENYLCLPQHLIFWTTEPQIHRGYAGLVLICLVGITVASSLPQAAWIRLQSQCLCFVHRTAVYSIYISFIRSANRSYSIQALAFVHAMTNTLNNLLRVLITILIKFSQPTCGQSQFLSLQSRTYSMLRAYVLILKPLVAVPAQLAWTESHYAVPSTSIQSRDDVPGIASEISSIFLHSTMETAIPSLDKFITDSVTRRGFKSIPLAKDTTLQNPSSLNMTLSTESSNPMPSCGNSFLSASTTFTEDHSLDLEVSPTPVGCVDRWGNGLHPNYPHYHTTVSGLIEPASSTHASKFIPATPVTSITAPVTTASGAGPTETLGQETSTGAASNGDPPANSVPTQSFSNKSPTSALLESSKATHDSTAGASDSSQSFSGSVLLPFSMPAAVKTTSGGSAPAEPVSQPIANAAATLPTTVAIVVDPTLASAGQGSTATSILRPLPKASSSGIGALIMNAFESQPPEVGSSGVVVPSLVMPASTIAHQAGVDAAVVSNTMPVFNLADSSAVPLQSPPPDMSPAVFTVAGETFTANPTGFIIAGTIVTPGGPPAVISGTPVSLGPSGVFIGGSTMPLRAPSLNQIPSVFTAAGQAFTANPTGFNLAGTAVLLDGPAVTISGTPVSLGSSNLVIGGSTFAIKTPFPGRVPSVFTVADQMFTANPTGFAIASVTVSPGGPAVTISGTPISLGPSGLVVGTSTVALITTPPTQAEGSVFTEAGRIFTANPTGFSIGGKSVSPGGSAVTVDGTPISLGPSGLVIGTSTIPLPRPSLDVLNKSAFTIAGQTFTPNPTGFSIAGTTLLPGSEITISGTIVSLGTSDIVVGNSTVPLPNSNSSAQSLNSAITSTAELSPNSAQISETSVPGSTDAKTSPPRPMKGAAPGRRLCSGYLGSLFWVMVVFEVLE